MRSIITVFFLSINKRLHLFSYFTETFGFKLFLVKCGKVYSSQDINIAVKLQHSTKLGTNTHHRNRVGLRPIRLGSERSEQIGKNYDRPVI